MARIHGPDSGSRIFTNKVYNSTDRVKSADYGFRFSDAEFVLEFSTSVFNHLLPVILLLSRFSLMEDLRCLAREVEAGIIFGYGDIVVGGKTDLVSC